MYQNNRESGVKPETARNPVIYLAIAAMAIAGFGCRWSAEVGPGETGLAVNGSGRSTDGVEAWIGWGSTALDVSVANRRYGVLARAEIIKSGSGIPTRILWGKEVGIFNRNAAPNSPGPYLEDLR